MAAKGYSDHEIKENVSLPPKASAVKEPSTRSPYDFEQDAYEVADYSNRQATRRLDELKNLTHEERQELQHFEAMSRLSDPHGLLNKRRAILEPKHDAKKLLKQMTNASGAGESASDDDPSNSLLVNRNMFDEIVSRIRATTRREKMETSKIEGAKVPNFNGITVDPIARHVQRRSVRINAMIRDHLEQIIACNDPSFIFGDLGVTSITLKRVEMTSGKSTIKCYYTVTGTDLDENKVQELLEKAQKKVRFSLARKLELGYTPPVVFIKDTGADTASVRRISASPGNAFNMPLECSLKQLGENFHKKMVAF